jgi:hypothetical protein
MRRRRERRGEEKEEENEKDEEKKDEEEGNKDDEEEKKEKEKNENYLRFSITRDTLVIHQLPIGITLKFIFPFRFILYQSLRASKMRRKLLVSDLTVTIC